MTKGVAGPRITVLRRMRATTRAMSHANSVMQKSAWASCPAKNTPVSRMSTGSFAPHVMKGAVSMVASFSLGERRVREASTPGTAHPPPMPPEMMKGITEEPCRPKMRNTRSSM